MSRRLLLGLLVIFFSLPAGAQVGYPPVEVSAGYAYVNLDVPGFLAQTQNAHGFGGSLNGNFNRHFGFSADFAAQYGDVSPGPPLFCIAIFPPPPACLQPPSTNFSAFHFLAGPRVTGRSQRFTTFAHALFGVAHTRTSPFSLVIPLPPPLRPIPLSIPEASDNNFAMGFGGGFDVNANRRVALRVLQFDYVPVHTDAGFLHNFRFKSGVVLKLGSP